MNILVTGGSGFIGTAMIRELLTFGYSVRNFDKNRSVELGELSTAGGVGHHRERFGVKLKLIKFILT